MLSPENPRGYFNYAYVMELQHKYDEALDYIYKASNYTDDVEKIKAARNRIMSLKRRYGRLKKAEEKRKESDGFMTESINYIIKSFHNII